MLRKGLAPVTLGLLFGVLAAATSGSVLTPVLFRVPSADPVTYAFVLTTLAGAAALATYVPARRAVRSDPLRALRVE